MNILEIENLGKRFLNRRGAEICALDSVGFSIEEGQAFGLVGGSGSGKSTLALCVLRLLEPSTGKIRFGGLDWLALRGKDLRGCRRRMQPVFQDPDSSLNPRFRIRQVIEEPLTAHGIGNRKERLERVEWLQARVGLNQLDLERFPRELSGGQRQRVAIARALAPEPDLLIADEPVSSLDTTTQHQIILLLTEFKKELKLAMLFISHDVALVASFCDVVGVIFQGRLVELVASKELFRCPVHPYTQALVEAAASGLPHQAEREFVPERNPLREILPGHWAAI